MQMHFFKKNCKLVKLLYLLLYFLKFLTLDKQKKFLSDGITTNWIDDGWSSNQHSNAHT